MTDFEKLMYEIAKLLDGILVEDLTPTEHRIVKMLVKENVLTISKDDDPLVEMKK